ncbi:MAG TPA: thioredoxin domain-containing protein [Steroidobacteraceae bacterium]
MTGLRNFFSLAAACFWLINAGNCWGLEPAVARPSTGAVVAKVNGKPLAYAQVSSDIDAKLAQMQHKYEVQLQQLTLGNARSRSELLENHIQDVVDQQVLGLEATARKSSLAGLLQSVKPRAVSEDQVHAFYESQQSQIGQPYDDVAPQIKQYLDKEAAAEAKDGYLRVLRKKYQAVVTWEPVREEIEALGPQRGPDNAVITIVEFSDFQCPFCGRMAPVLRALLKEYPTQVRLLFRNMPLTGVHPNAQKASEAAVCADQQGKFWSMHDLLYAEQNSLSADALKEKAKRLSLDSSAFDDCLDAGHGSATVKADVDAGEHLGIASTPASFLNGRFVGGALPLFQWRALVEDELERVARKATP